MLRNEVPTELSHPVELAAVWHDLVVEGRDLGEVKVWSSGAPRTPVPGLEPQRQLLIGMRVKNDSRTELRLDVAATTVEVHPRQAPDVDLGPPVRVEGPERVAPGAFERIELTFALPAGVRLADLLGYELVWSIVAGEARVSRVTAFRRVRPSREVRYLPYDAYEGPWLVDPFWSGRGVPVDESYPGGQ